MGRHYKRKDSLKYGLIKLALLAVFLLALSALFFRFYPEKVPPSVVSGIERIFAVTDRFRSKIVSETGPSDEKKTVTSPASRDAAPGKKTPRKEPADQRPLLAIVVDDGGNNLDMAKKVASLDLPLTWAILPYTGYASKTAELADGLGIPYMLHLPMQAEIDKDSKAYLVGEGMDRSKIRDITVKALNSLPSPIGINNHRGSLATSKWDIMVPIIDVLKEKKMLFLDSRTSGKSVAYEAAKAAGITALRNRGFLDGTTDKNSISARFEQAVKTAGHRGSMIVICHFRPATLLFLEELNKRYTELPVRLVTLPEMAEILKENEDKEEE